MTITRGLFSLLLLPGLLLAGELRWSNPAVRCQIDGPVTVTTSGDVVGKCRATTPQPPPSACQAPTGLTVVATGPIERFNGEQSVIRQNEYYAISFVAPARIAYFGFSKIEQVVDANFFATISKCPGDFVNIPARCWASGRTFSLHGDTGAYSGCPLIRGERYWLNVRAALPRITAGRASGNRRADNTCPPGARCGFTVRATLQ